MIARFFHRLWHYHCEECLHEEMQSKVCNSCEILKQQLALANQENTRLLSLILQKNEPEQALPTTELVQLPPKNVPWRVKREMLEQADREAAAALRRNQSITEIADLEKELGVDNAS